MSHVTSRPRHSASIAASSTPSMRSQSALLLPAQPMMPSKSMPARACRSSCAPFGYLHPAYFGRDGPTMHFAVCSYPRRIRGRLRSPWINRGRVLRIAPRFQRPVKRTWIVESLDGRMNRVIAGHGRISSAEGMRWTRSVDPRATIRATTATRVLRSPPPSETVRSRDFLTAARLSLSIKVQVSVVQQNMNP